MFFSHKFRCNYDAILLDKIVAWIDNQQLTAGLQESYCMVVFTDDPHAFFFTHSKELETGFLDLLRKKDIQPLPVGALDMHRVVSVSTCNEKRVVGSYGFFTKIL